MNADFRLILVRVLMGVEVGNTTAVDGLGTLLQQFKDGIVLVRIATHTDVLIVGMS
jgi:hypothetical protein